MNRSLPLLLLTPLAACGGGGIKHHPVEEIAARSEARVDLVELAIADPERAARVRALYLQVEELRRGFVEARDEAWAHGAKRQASPDFSEIAERVEASATDAYSRYATLMIEIRSLVGEREFRRLNAIR